MKMAISEKNRSSERGMTLFEALIAVAILALASGVAAGAIGALSPRLVVDRAADQLVVDLKRARLAAQTSGSSVTILATDDGYRVHGLDIDRRFPSGLANDWNAGGARSIDFVVGLGQQGAAVTLRKGRSEAVIKIAAVSGRIERAQ